MAIAYVGEREQFGKKIGTYQAVSHPLVDAYVARRARRSLAYWAAWCVAERRRAGRLACAAANAQATEAAVRACETSIQVHGGIGFTFEHPLHRYYKRSLELEGALGFGRELRAEIAAYLLSLVTGASSGIGEACARRLAGLGWEVYASVRNAGDAPEGTRELVFDVTDADATRRALASIESLDALVATPGSRSPRRSSSCPPEELTRQLDVNVVGQLRVVQPLLPLLRRSRGRVVLMGSIGGRSALPFLGAYAMSKFALEAFADSLRVEVAPWGMHVAIVEPGTIATAMWTKPQRALDEFPPEAAELYGERIERFRRLAAARSANGVPAEEVAKAVEHALTSPKPRTRYVVGPDARSEPRVQTAPRPAARPRAHAVPVRIVGSAPWDTSQLARRARRGLRIPEGPRARSA